MRRSLLTAAALALLTIAATERSLLAFSSVSSPIFACSDFTSTAGSASAYPRIWYSGLADLSLRIDPYSVVIGSAR